MTTYLMTNLLLVFHVHVFRVDHAFVFLGLTVSAWFATGGGARRWTARSRSRRRLGRLVHLLSQLVRGCGQFLARFVHGRLVVRLERLLGVATAFSTSPRSEPEILSPCS